jgi:ABC-type glycerol-3-phosphate transport system substrate-binding protein
MERMVGLVDRPLTRRAYTQVALAGMATGVLASCSGPGGEPAPAPSAREVTISYMTDWSGGTRAEWIKAAIPKFTQENPKITVTVDTVTTDIKVVALTNAAAGTLSDTLLAGGDTPHQLVKGGVMQDITPVLKTQKFKMDDVVWIPSTIQVQGKQYGMPFQWNHWAMVVNKTLFKQAGATLPTDQTSYPDLLDQLRRIAKPDEKVYGIDLSNSIWYWHPYVWAYGGEVISTDRKKTLLDQPAAIEGLQFYVDMANRSRVAHPLDDSGKPPQGVAFTSGNVAVALANAPGKGLNDAIAGKFEWDVMYHPLGPKNKKRFVWVSEQPNLVTANAARKGAFEQAVQFVVWVATSKTAQELVVDIGTGSWPVSKAVLNSPKYLAGPPPGVKILIDEIPAFHDPQIGLGWLDWRTEITADVLPALTGKKAVQEAAQEMTRAADAILAKNVS